MKTRDRSIMPALVYLASLTIVSAFLFATTYFLVVTLKLQELLVTSAGHIEYQIAEILALPLLIFASVIWATSIWIRVVYKWRILDVDEMQEMLGPRMSDLFKKRLTRHDWNGSRK